MHDAQRKIIEQHIRLYGHVILSPRIAAEYLEATRPAVHPLMIPEGPLLLLKPKAAAEAKP